MYLITGQMDINNEVNPFLAHKLYDTAKTGLLTPSETFFHVLDWNEAKFNQFIDNSHPSFMSAVTDNESDSDSNSVSSGVTITKSPTPAIVKSSGATTVKSSSFANGKKSSGCHPSHQISQLRQQQITGGHSHQISQLRKRQWQIIRCHPSHQIFQHHQSHIHQPVIFRSQLT